MKREKKIQKELREVERMSFASKEMQENFMESMQHQLQEVEKGRTISPEGAKEVTKDTKHPRLEKNIQKKAWRQEKKCGKSETKLCVRKSASHCWRSKSAKTQWHMRKWKQNFRECRLEKKEEVAMHRTRLNAVWRRWWNKFSLSKFDAISQIFFKKFETFAPPVQMPGREEGRRDSENEQEQGRASQQLVSLTPGGVNQVAPASSLELDLPRVRSVPGEGGSAGRPGKSGPSSSPGRPSGDEEGDDDLGDLVP